MCGVYMQRNAHSCECNVLGRFRIYIWDSSSIVLFAPVVGTTAIARRTSCPYCLHVVSLRSTRSNYNARSSFGHSATVLAHVTLQGIIGPVSFPHLGKHTDTSPRYTLEGIIGPGPYGVEDPFLYQDPRGGFHALFHAGHQGGGYAAAGGHAFSPDGLTWTFSAAPAYYTTVNTSDGQAHQYSRRERPHLVFNGEGAPTHLSTSLWVGPADHTVTFVQAIATTGPGDVATTSSVANAATSSLAHTGITQPPAEVAATIPPGRAAALLANLSRCASQLADNGPELAILAAARLSLNYSASDTITIKDTALSSAAFYRRNTPNAEDLANAHRLPGLEMKATVQLLAIAVGANGETIC